MENVIEFEEDLILDNGVTTTNLGKFKNRMELFLNEKSGNGYIVWNYGKKAADEDETVIGLRFNHNKELEDYDGLYDLPKEAITLIRQNGYDLNENLRECYPY